MRVAHPSTLTSRTDARRLRLIAHLDIDAFFAAVEMHRRPELRGRPLVVGGDPHGRGVVATANYAARRFGIRSAMSAAEALRRCPDVVIVRPDIAPLPRVVGPGVGGGARAVARGRGARPGRGLPGAARRGRRRAPPTRCAARWPSGCGCRAPSGSPPARSWPRSPPTATSPAASPWCRRAARPRSWRRCPCAPCRAWARAPTSACAPRASRRSATSPPSTTRPWRRSAPGRHVAGPAPPRARHRPAAGRADPGRAHLDLVRAHVRRGRQQRRRAGAHRSRPGGARGRDAADARAGGADRDGQAALHRLPDRHARPDRAGRHRRRAGSSGRPPAGCWRAR